VVLNHIRVSRKRLMLEHTGFPWCYKRSCFDSKSTLDSVWCDACLLHVYEHVWIHRALGGLSVAVYPYFKLDASSLFAPMFGCLLRR